MGIIELVSISIALAMDAFAVAIATGVALKRVSSRQTFRLAWHFGLFQALMPIIGWYLGSTVRSSIEAYDHWIAFGLLGYIGFKMIRESFDKDEESQGDPTRGMTLVVLSVATSIDALAVGFSLSMLGLSIWWPALVIGVVALLFTAVGLHLGKSVSEAKGIGSYAELVGGIVLIGIGIKILWEHGVLTL
ncbi:manganese efflux pump MntP [Halodesulfovibrio marinisediminis]|uniref:Putative manganese efflux pump MntP n=1 Tax=Halodesulfovibrio marinisediminis DSM 17456 TaxID=1121457 RepID=A0A1N6DW45_9BACT|nr:manganese efflux pump MntP family protein [Halodesulfovibrio marinisediminis]SIN74992.1 Putative Mn2+ efflux pump MntP [Halodesulfovibrio marinisediminis DSM 17456]